MATQLIYSCISVLIYSLKTHKHQFMYVAQHNAYVFEN